MEPKVNFATHNGQIYVHIDFPYSGERVCVLAPIVPVRKIGENVVYTWIPDLSHATGDRFLELVESDRNFSERVTCFVSDLGRQLKGEGDYSLGGEESSGYYKPPRRLGNPHKMGRSGRVLKRAPRSNYF